MIDTVVEIDTSKGLLGFMPKTDDERNRRLESSDSSACEGCGNCCEAFTLSNPIAEVQKEVSVEDYYDQRFKKWITEDIVPINREDAVGILKEKFLDGEIFRCTLFDTEAKRCTDYDNRPTICMRYPGYAFDDDRKHSNVYESCELFDELAAKEMKNV